MKPKVASVFSTGPRRAAAFSSSTWIRPLPPATRSGRRRSGDSSSSFPFTGSTRSVAACAVANVVVVAPAVSYVIAALAADFSAVVVAAADDEADAVFRL